MLATAAVRRYVYVRLNAAYIARIAPGLPTALFTGHRVAIKIEEYKQLTFRSI